MRAILFILALLVPLADLFLLRFLLPLLGWQPLLAWVILTFFIGITIVRLAGAGAIHNFRLQLQSGSMPGRQTIDDGLHILAGILVAWPGFLTDFIALPLLLRSTRRLVTSLLVAVLRKRFGLPELDENRPVYTIGPDGRPIRDIEVEIHDDAKTKPPDQPKS